MTVLRRAVPALLLLAAAGAAQVAEPLIGMTPPRGMTVYGKGGFLGTYPGAGPFAPVAGEAGRAVAFVDLDADGFEDLLVGAPKLPTVALGQVLDDAGHLYVIFGGADVSLPASPASFDLAAIPAGTAIHYVGQPGDQLGASVARAGDVNGDGFQDAIVGAPNRTVGGRTSAGGAYVLFGGPGFRAQASTAFLVDVATTTHAVFVQGARAFGRSGASVSGNVDSNADGRSDVVLGAPLDSTMALSQNGTATVLYGQVGLPSLSLLDLATQGSGQVTVVHGAADFQFAGWSVAGIGRFDAVLPMTPGTTHPTLGDDVAVGAPGTQVGSDLLAGAVYVLRGVASGTPAASFTTADFGNGPNTAGVAYLGTAPGDQAGLSVARIGNMAFDAMGFEAFALAAPFNDGIGKADSSSAYLVFGGAGPQGFDLGAIPFGAAVQIQGAATNAGLLGVSLSDGGDLNSDGVRDVAVGYPNASVVNGVSVLLGAGRVRVLDGSVLLASAGIVYLGNPAVAHTLVELTGEASGDRAGLGLALGDHDGDGRRDIGIGAPGAASPQHPQDPTLVANLETGRAHVYFGPILQAVSLVPTTSWFGGPPVTLTAIGVPADGATVTVEGVPATVLSFTPGAVGTITFAPPQPPTFGVLADVAVTTSTGDGGLANALQYQLLSVTTGPTPPSGFAGNSVSFTGSAFSGVADTTVTVDGVPATVSAVNGLAGTMTVLLPDGPPGNVPLDVVVSNSNGSVTLSDALTYLPLVVGTVAPTAGPQTSGVYAPGTSPFEGTPPTSVNVDIDAAGSTVLTTDNVIVEFGTPELGWRMADVTAVNGNVVTVDLPPFLLGPANVLVDVRATLAGTTDQGVREDAFTYQASDFTELGGFAKPGLGAEAPTALMAGDMSPSGNTLLLLQGLGGPVNQATVLMFSIALANPPTPVHGGLIGVEYMPEFVFMLPNMVDELTISQTLPATIDPAADGMSVYVQVITNESDGSVTEYGFTDVLKMTFDL